MDQPRTVTVQGSAIERTRADRAEITVSARGFATDLAEAGREADAGMSQIVEALKAQGIRDRDLETSFYNAWQVGKEEGGRRVLQGYEVRNTMLVTICDVAKIGLIITALRETRAAEISGVRFTVSEQSGAEKRARTGAMDEASERARVYAQLAGADLGRVLQIRESPGGGAPPGDGLFAWGGGGVGGPGLLSVPAPIRPRDIEVVAQVEVTWELVDVDSTAVVARPGRRGREAPEA